MVIFVQDVLCFHMIFRIVLFVSVYNVFRILVRIEQNIQIAFSYVAISSTLILSSLSSSFYLLRSSALSLECINQVSILPLKCSLILYVFVCSHPSLLSPSSLESHISFTSHQKFGQIDLTRKGKQNREVCMDIFVGYHVK